MISATPSGFMEVWSSLFDVMSKKMSVNGKGSRPQKGHAPMRRNTNGKPSRRGNNSLNSLPTAYGVRTGTNLQKGIRLKKREFVMNVGHNAVGARGHKMFKSIVSGSNGTITSLAELAVNVGLAKSFPWLSNVAHFFDKFLFHSLSFEYVPSTGSSTPGTVSLCPTYKADESNEGATKVDLLDRAGSSRSATWQTNTCTIDPKKANAALKSHVVRQGEVDDIKMHDPARIDMLVETPAGIDGEADLGELWVDYDVSLEVPKGTVDTRAGSHVFARIAGSNVTVTPYMAMSSVLDIANWWIEPDPTNTYTILHIPFKKECVCLLTAWSEGRYGTTIDSDANLLMNRNTTESGGVVNSEIRVWAVSCGKLEGEFNKDTLKSGITFKAPRALPDAHDIMLWVGEVSENYVLPPPVEKAHVTVRREGHDPKEGEILRYVPQNFQQSGPESVRRSSLH